MTDDTRFRNNPQALHAGRAICAAIAYAVAPAIVLIGLLGGHLRGGVQLGSVVNIFGVGCIGVAYLMIDRLGAYLPGIVFALTLPIGALSWSNNHDWLRAMAITVVVAACVAVIQAVIRWGSTHFTCRPNLLAEIGRSLATMTWLR